ncbi:pyruvate dehydrogenase complex dihydrolipoamide acetyltransferase [Alcaligenaceae bacterium B3P038]|nr:pyruvate dehydrogenase complex dihydrolipoamide acetyltransferase [Alcaligenaceae bacterium B3P038]
MAQLIKMPAVAADSATGSIAQWLKKEGDRVAVGDAIAEIETDKAIVEIAAEHAGVLARIVAPAGDAQLPVNAVLAVLTAEGEGADAIDRALSAEGKNDAGQKAAAGADGAEGFAAKRDDDQDRGAARGTHPGDAAQPSREVGNAGAAAQFSPDEGNAGAARARDAQPADHTTHGVDAMPAGTGSERLFSSPAARRIAADNQIDLRQIVGSGPRGRILKHDVERAAQAAQGRQTASDNAALRDRQMTPDVVPANRTPHSNMRRAIARRLTESKTTIPHFYLSLDCRMDVLLALRHQIGDDGHARISVNDFIVRAAALALVAVPEVNVSWEDDALIQHGSADIAVAVATEGGLVTPIVRHAHSKTLRQVAAEIAELAARGRAQRLKPQEYTGGSMTVSNLGMYGITQFAAIINPPQAAILAVGAASARAVVDDAGALGVATVMTVTLSADHRAIDGAVAARWLAAFKQLIEHPVRILL